MLPTASGSATQVRPNALSARTTPPLPSASDLVRTCANCGSRLEERKCKLICHGCGYFLSCSDYY